jgi:N-dimethylarginine dimethylaminohydrolase
MKTSFLMGPPPRAAAAAYRQWQRLVEFVQCAGDARIERAAVESDRAGAFPGGSALVCGKLAVLASTPQASKGTAHRKALARLGFATVPLEETRFGGAADAVFDRCRPILYVGCGDRTEHSAAGRLGKLLGVRTLALQLTDERLPHLDQVLCPLANGHVLVHLPALTPAAQKALRRVVDGDALIEVSTADALAYACSPIEFGDALVMHPASRRLRERLQASGYRLFATDLSEFHALGGSARRMALRLTEGPPSGLFAA